MCQMRMIPGTRYVLTVSLFVYSSVGGGTHESVGGGTHESVGGGTHDTYVPTNKQLYR